jgi:hypothetical protein
MTKLNNVVNKNVGVGASPKELATLAVAKVFTERLTTHYLKENATLKSGVPKILGGVGVALFVKNKYVRYACAGIVLDGFEDVAEVGYNFAKRKVAPVTAKVVGKVPQLGGNQGGLAPAY